MKKTIRKISVLLISLILIFSLTACNPLESVYGGIFDFIFEDIFGLSKSSEEENYDDEIETPIETQEETESAEEEYTYDIPEYTGYDEAVIEALCEELEELASGSDFDAICECFEELSDEFDLLYDQEILAYLVYCSDASDTELYEDYNELYLMVVTCCDAAYIAMKAVLAGPCGEEFAEYIGSEAAEELYEYEELTEQELEWAEEENDLVAEYNAAYEEFEASGSSDYSELNETVGPIYLELVALRTEMAQYYGYDNYAEYADAEIYGRDYSTEEAEVLHEAVKEFSAEYYTALYGSYAYFGLYYSGISLTSQEVLDAAYTYGEQISSYITETLDLMLEYELCDIDEDDDRINGSFSTSFSCGAPTMFVNMNGWSDFQTVSHELGHCVNFYLTSDRGNVLLSSSGSYDILEIHSNGLEALYTQYYDEIFGDSSGYAYSFTLMELLMNVVDGAIYDEFQREVYENPDMTLDEINALFAEIQEEYGSTYIDENYWVLVPHNFESPMYYVSYAASALAALQIWALAQDDYDAAVSVWEEIVSLDAADTEYLDLLEETGLGSFLDDGAAGSVCEAALETALTVSMQSSGIYFYFGD